MLERWCALKHGLSNQIDSKSSSQGGSLWSGSLFCKVETVVVWWWVSLARAWFRHTEGTLTNIVSLQPVLPFTVIILDTAHPNPATLQTEDTRPLAESSGLITWCHVAYSQPAEPQREEGTCPCSQILDVCPPPCAALPLISTTLLSLFLIYSATLPTPFMNWASSTFSVLVPSIFEERSSSLLPAPSTLFFLSAETYVEVLSLDWKPLEGNLNSKQTW